MRRELVGEISLAEAALRLRASWHQAYALMLSGTLAGRRVGRFWFVDESSVERAMRERSAVRPGATATQPV